MKKSIKFLVFAVIAAALVAGSVLAGRYFQRSKDVLPSQKEGESLSQKESETLSQKDWREAYTKYFNSEHDYVFSNEGLSAYVTDVDNDGIPEVLMDTWFGGTAPQFLLAYNRSTGAVDEIEFNFGGSSGLHTAYISKPYVIFRWEGTSYGTAGARFAEKYGMREPEHVFDIVDSVALAEEDVENTGENEGSEAYYLLAEAAFNAKFNQWTKDMNLVDYTDVCCKKNVLAYIMEELGITIETAAYPQHICPNKAKQARKISAPVLLILYFSSNDW